jgi:hypothetical protein
MPILTAIHAGLRRVSANPQLIIFLWLLNFLLALPMMLILSDQIESSIGASLIHEKLRAGFDIDWYEEFAFSANGLGKTFSPSVIGVGPFLNNVEAWLDGSLLAGHLGVISLGIAYAIIWMFVLGGILDHLAQRRENLTMANFFSASGRYFLRFWVLSIFSISLYLLVFTFVAPLLFSSIANAARNVTVERTVFFLVAGAYAIIGFLLIFVNMAFDYAKISTVLRNHRNMLDAALEGFRCIFSNPRKTFGLYLILGLTLLLFLGIYGLIAPGAEQANIFTVATAFLIGQGFLVVKLMTRLTFFGGQMALYEAVTGEKTATANS